MLLKDIVILKVSDRLRCDHIVNTVSATPVLRLASDEGTHGT